jgi:hypothetical protein
MLPCKSKNQRSSITRHIKHEESGIKARARATFPGAGSCAEISKENEFPFRTGLIFLLLFLSRKKVSRKRLLIIIPPLSNPCPQSKNQIDL